MSEFRIDMGIVRGEPYLNVHGNTGEEIDGTIKSALPIFKKFRDAVEKGKEKQAEDNQPPGGVPKCATCGEHMEYKEGWGKNNKKWKAWFCPNSEKGKPGHDPVWV